MEDYYFLINDCIQNLSTLFTFNHLLRLSTMSKRHLILIYQLKNHDHDNRPIYYTSTDQIKKFYNIHTLTIPRYCFYRDQHKLTHINHIIFHNSRLIDEVITNLTHLTSCTLIENRFINPIYFHTNLKKLYDFNNNHEKYNISDIISFTQLTYINTFRLNGSIQTDLLIKDLAELSTFTNLRSLASGILENMTQLTQFPSLHKLWIEGDISEAFVLINNRNLTNVKISDVEYVQIESNNLKYLELIDCEKCILNISSRLQTLIWWMPHDEYELHFDVNKCINLEHLEYNYNLISLDEITVLNKLNSLHIDDSIDIEIDNNILTNLTYLSLTNCQNDYPFNLRYCTNLKILILWSMKYINLNNLIQLEHLALMGDSNVHESKSIDLSYHLNLTYLRMENCRFINLHRLSKLNNLLLFDFDHIDGQNLWDHDLIYLTNLMYLSLNSKYVGSKIYDCANLSNCKSLKYFHCNNFLNGLNLCESLNHLNIPYCMIYYNSIRRLTKLTNLNYSFDKSANDFCELKRLCDIGQDGRDVFLIE